jgi:hypothetical protein
MELFSKSIFFGILILMIGCKHQKDSEVNQTGDEILPVDTVFQRESEIDYQNEANGNVIWQYDYMNDTILRLRNTLADNLSTANLIALLNHEYQGKVFLEFVKIAADTMYVKIADSAHLTQRMGSAGAMEYMIVTTFTLTELRELHYVNFSFEYGDHAMPGTYSRKYFLDWMAGNKLLSNI